MSADRLTPVEALPPEERAKAERFEAATDEAEVSDDMIVEETAAVSDVFPNHNIEIKLIGEDSFEIIKTRKADADQAVTEMAGRLAELGLSEAEVSNAIKGFEQGRKTALANETYQQHLEQEVARLEKSVELLQDRVDVVSRILVDKFGIQDPEAYVDKLAHSKIALVKHEVKAMIDPELGSVVEDYQRWSEELTVKQGRLEQTKNVANLDPEKSWHNALLINTFITSCVMRDEKGSASRPGRL